MPSFSTLVRFVFFASAILGLVVVAEYGGGAFFPGLVAGFAGSLLAFMLALTWERERELQRAREEASELEQRRAIELQRRLEPIAAELEKNEESINESV